MKFKRFSKGEKILGLLLLAIAVGIIGANMNLFVMENNSCKMPVYSGLYLDDGVHLSYLDKAAMPYYYLTDIFYLFHGRMIVSAGDILIFISAFFVSYFTVSFILLKHKKKFKIKTLKGE